MNEKNTQPLGEYSKLYELTDGLDKKRISKPEIDLEAMYRSDLKLKEMLKDTSDDCAEELLAGFTAIEHYPKTVTFFGSARTKPGAAFYELARDLAGEICKEGYAVITGGGPGIMEAANRGTKETCGYAVGFNIELPTEQVINEYVTHGINFKFFSARKMAMFFSGEAFLFFPGGFGTLDELFQLLTLIQTHKAPNTPVILVGAEYWNNLNKFIKNTLLDEFETISKDDLDLYTISDDKEEIMNIIRNAPLRSAY